MNEPISEQAKREGTGASKTRGLRFPFDPIHIQQAFTFQAISQSRGILV